MVRREGAATGTGLRNDAAISEFGRHDIGPGVNGDPSGYLVATKGEGNLVYLKRTVRAIFLPGKDGTGDSYVARRMCLNMSASIRLVIGGWWSVKPLSCSRGVGLL